jgi:hypothetical protein
MKEAKEAAVQSKKRSLEEDEVCPQERMAMHCKWHNMVVMRRWCRRCWMRGGADVNAQGGHHGNALQAASCGGREKVV